jgi:hypothetical protein
MRHAVDSSGSPTVSSLHLKKFVAIWDTGATASVVTQAVIDRCGLIATGMTQVHGIHGDTVSDTFLVTIGLPNKVLFQELRVTRGELPGGAEGDILIGMDIIGRGDFAVTNRDGITVFSFRLPSKAHIDFVREAALSDSILGQRAGGKRSTSKRPGKSFGKNK